MKNNVVKRTLACLTAVLCVTGEAAAAADTGLCGLFGGTSIIAGADDESQPVDDSSDESKPDDDSSDESSDADDSSDESKPDDDSSDDDSSSQSEEEEPIIPISIDKTYLKAGSPVVVDNPAGYALEFYVGDDLIADAENVLTEEYYENWITVKAYDPDRSQTEPVSEDRVYFSNLPVMYINTDDGTQITSRETYKSGTLNIQGNTVSDGSEYNGIINIRGRGNMSWGWPKKSFRLKLDKKTDLFGMGANKNWVLLSNYLDECFLRNKVAFGLAKELGLESMDCTWTDVVFNGEYIGNYLLCEQVRIDDTRVDIFDWESEAKDNAKAITKAQKKKGNIIDQDALEEQMKSDFSWVTSGEVEFEGSVYETGKTYDNFSGGYLFEISDEYDEVSKFTTRAGLKVMLKSPEFLCTNPEMMKSAQTIWNDFERAVRSEDGYIITADGKRKHYTDLADIDSMISYWLVMEIMGNIDAVQKSRYAYIDIDSKLVFGPAWDFDISSASPMCRQGAVGWALSKRDHDQEFFKEFLDDPLFITKATEKYWEIRPYLEELIKTGGYIDTQIEYLSYSGAADEARWERPAYDPEPARSHAEDAEMFRNYMAERVAWLDTQFEKDNTLLTSTNTELSAAPYKRDGDKLTVRVCNGVKDLYTDHAPADAVITPDKTIYLDIKTTDSDTYRYNVYVNGLYYKALRASTSSVYLKLPEEVLTAPFGKKNIISVIGRDAEGFTTCRNFCTLILTDGSEVTIPGIQPEYISTYNGPRFRWSKINGAEKYCVIAEVNNKWITIAQTVDNYCVLSNLPMINNCKVAVAALVGGDWYIDFDNYVIATPYEPPQDEYPDGTVITHDEKHHRFKVTWSAVENAEQYVIGFKRTGRWKVGAYTDGDVTSLISPTLRKGSRFEMVICAKVDGKWDIEDFESRAITVSVR